MNNRPQRNDRQNNRPQPYMDSYQQQSVDPWESNSFYINQMMNQGSQMNVHQIPKTIYTINCGEARPRDEGTRVKISGKVTKRRAGRFLDIKDVKGCTQLVATDDKPDISMQFQSVPADAYITIIGTIQSRPSNFVNHVSLYALHFNFVVLNLDYFLGTFCL